MDQIRIYNVLRNALKMSDQDASEFISAMGTMTNRELDAKIQLLATKDDILATKKDIQATKEEIHQLALVTKDSIYQLALSTKNDIRDLNNKIYLSGLVQYIAIIASILAIVKFMK